MKFLSHHYREGTLQLRYGRMVANEVVDNRNIAITDGMLGNREDSGDDNKSLESLITKFDSGADDGVKSKPEQKLEAAIVSRFDKLETAFGQYRSANQARKPSSPESFDHSLRGGFNELKEKFVIVKDKYETKKAEIRVAKQTAEAPPVQKAANVALTPSLAGAGGDKIDAVAETTDQKFEKFDKALQGLLRRYKSGITVSILPEIYNTDAKKEKITVNQGEILNNFKSAFDGINNKSRNFICSTVVLGNKNEPNVAGPTTRSMLMFSGSSAQITQGLLDSIYYIGEKSGHGPATQTMADALKVGIKAGDIVHSPDGYAPKNGLKWLAPEDVTNFQVTSVNAEPKPEPKPAKSAKGAGDKVVVKLSEGAPDSNVNSVEGEGALNQKGKDLLAALKAELPVVMNKEFSDYHYKISYNNTSKKLTVSLINNSDSGKSIDAFVKIEPDGRFSFKINNNEETIPDVTLARDGLVQMLLSNGKKKSDPTVLEKIKIVAGNESPVAVARTKGPSAASEPVTETTDASTPLEIKIKEADNKLKANDFSEALKLYEQAAKLAENGNSKSKDSYIFTALLGKGQCLTGLRRYKEALVVFDTMIATAKSLKNNTHLAAVENKKAAVVALQTPKAAAPAAAAPATAGERQFLAPQLKKTVDVGTPPPRGALDTGKKYEFSRDNIDALEAFNITGYNNVFNKTVDGLKVAPLKELVDIHKLENLLGAAKFDVGSSINMGSMDHKKGIILSIAQLQKRLKVNPENGVFDKTLYDTWIKSDESIEAKLKPAKAPPIPPSADRLSVSGDGAAAAPESPLVLWQKALDAKTNDITKKYSIKFTISVPMSDFDEKDKSVDKTMDSLAKAMEHINKNPRFSGQLKKLNIILHNQNDDISASSTNPIFSLNIFQTAPDMAKHIAKCVFDFAKISPKGDRDLRAALQSGNVVADETNSDFVPKKGFEWVEPGNAFNFAVKKAGEAAKPAPAVAVAPEAARESDKNLKEKATELIKKYQGALENLKGKKAADFTNPKMKKLTDDLLSTVRSILETRITSWNDNITRLNDPRPLQGDTKNEFDNVVKGGFIKKEFSSIVDEALVHGPKLSRSVKAQIKLAILKVAQEKPVEGGKDVPPVAADVDYSKLSDANLVKAHGEALEAATPEQLDLSEKLYAEISRRKEAKPATPELSEGEKKKAEKIKAVDGVMKALQADFRNNITPDGLDDAGKKAYLYNLVSQITVLGELVKKFTKGEQDIDQYLANQKTIRRIDFNDAADTDHTKFIKALSDSYRGSSQKSVGDVKDIDRGAPAVPVPAPAKMAPAPLEKPRDTTATMAQQMKEGLDSELKRLPQADKEIGTKLVAAIREAYRNSIEKKSNYPVISNLLPSGVKAMVKFDNGAVSFEIKQARSTDTIRDAATLLSSLIDYVKPKAAPAAAAAVPGAAKGPSEIKALSDIPVTTRGELAKLQREYESGTSADGKNIDRHSQTAFAQVMDAIEASRRDGKAHELVQRGLTGWTILDKSKQPITVEVVTKGTNAKGEAGEKIIYKYGNAEIYDIKAFVTKIHDEANITAFSKVDIGALSAQKERFNQKPVQPKVEGKEKAPGIAEGIRKLNEGRLSDIRPRVGEPSSNS